jgi:hypothetical protein
MSPSTPDAVAAAVAALAADGHAFAGIAAHLNKRGLRAPRGGLWSTKQVARVAEKHGIVVAYDPTKIAAATVRDAAVSAAPVAPPERDVAGIERAAAIEQYAAEQSITRALVEQAAAEYDSTLDWIAWCAEAGPIMPEVASGPDATEQNKVARKEAERVWLDCVDVERELRELIAGKDAVSAVEAIFCWHAEHNLTMRALRAQFDARRVAFEGQPTRVELRRRLAERAAIYRSPEPKGTETVAELVSKAERAVRVRLLAAEQAEADYKLFTSTRGLQELFDDLHAALVAEVGSTGRAMRAVAAAQRVLRHRRRQAAEVGPEVTLRDANRAAKSR